MVVVDDSRVTLAPLADGEWARLVDEHPPREGVDRGPVNEDTFPAALIAASIVGMESGDYETHVGPYLQTTFKAGEYQPAAAADLYDNGPVDAAEDLYETCLRLSAPKPLTWAVRRLQRDERLALEVAYCADHGLDPDVFAVWSQRSRDLVLAHYTTSRTRCPGCGVAWDAMHDLDAAVVEQRECFHCEARNAADAAVPEAAKPRVHTFVVPTRPDVGGED